MKNVIWLLSTNLQRQWRYRANFVGYLIVTSLFYLFQFIYLDKIIEFGQGSTELERSQVHLIYFLFGLTFLTVETMGTSIHRFFAVVARGQIEPYLVKPVGHMTWILFGWAAPSNVLIALVFGVSVAWGRNVLNVSVPAMQWLAFWLAWICVLAVNLTMILGLNLITFVSQRHLPVDYIHERIFDLSLVPTGLFPANVLRWLTLVVPVAVSSSLPVSILLHARYSLLMDLVASTTILILIVTVGYQKAFRHYEGVGG